MLMKNEECEHGTEMLEKWIWNTNSMGNNCNIIWQVRLMEQCRVIIRAHLEDLAVQQQKCCTHVTGLHILQRWWSS